MLKCNSYCNSCGVRAIKDFRLFTYMLGDIFPHIHICLYFSIQFVMLHTLYCCVYSCPLHLTTVMPSNSMSTSSTITVIPTSSVPSSVATGVCAVCFCEYFVCSMILLVSGVSRHVSALKHFSHILNALS